ncbi:hypothetical protein PORY_000108 [Pneumocystis oryctolagi]|uniref:Uncharacterized protein n=1 Tax=Pneumocystis oryctolagi TaxID=42067 RepID=A0ACB7CFG4_9ASCO|nr:hypothetical protein PORY_000108 [Pneumocystis oryctolagi]
MEKRLIRVGYVPEHFSAPILLAYCHGIFAKHRVDIKLVVCPGGSGQIIQRLQDGTLDIAIGLTEAFIVGCSSCKNSCKIVGTYVESRWAINTGKQSPYHIERDLDGCVMGISNIGSGSHIMSHVFANQETSKMENPFIFKVLNTFQKLVEAANSGEIAAFMWEYFTSKRCYDTGEIKKIGELYTPWPSWMIVANVYMLETSMLVGFLDAINDGISYFYQNTQEAVEYIIENFHYSKEDVLAWLETVKFSKDVRSISLDVVHQVVSVLQKAGLIPTNIIDFSSIKEFSEDFNKKDILKDLLSLDLCEGLDKEVFLEENFDVDEFLKKIYKFHTLEDLQTKLKELSKVIENDFVEFVQDKYDDFFEFTNNILENENKMIDLSVYLTKFKNEIQNIRDTIQQNILRIDEELRKKNEIYTLFTNLLNVNAMIEDMENLLSLIANESENNVEIVNLQELAKSYIFLKYYLSLIPPQHSFIEERKEKIQFLQKNMFNYLALALNEYRKDTPNDENLLKVLQIYRELDASSEACHQLYNIKKGVQYNTHAVRRR